MANNRSTSNQNASANLSIRDHRAILARISKHDREVSTLQHLLVFASASLPWIVEVQELRGSGYTYGEIAQRLDITRDTVAAVLRSQEAA
jgi:DNA-binding NarL/FixJ family response regulator